LVLATKIPGVVVTVKVARVVVTVVEPQA